MDTTSRKETRLMTSERTRAGGERGAMLVLAAAGMVIAMIASALAVDLGRLASDKRDDQKIADMAALDASRDLTNVCPLAQASATRNGYSGTLPCANVVLGHVDPTTHVFTTGGANDAVQVTVRSSFGTVFKIVNGPSSTGGKAVAGLRNPVSFSLGSGVASVDANRSTLLNSTIGQMLCSPVCATGNAGLILANWQGLATGRLSLSALQTSLASAGFSVGSVSQLLSASMTLAQLYTATASALTTGGDAADASIFSALALKATSTTQITLGQLIHVQQGADTAALGTSINLMQLVTGTAEVANKNHAIDVSNAGIAVGDVTSTRVQMTVIEAPVMFIGSFGDVGVTTAQVNLTVTPTLNVVSIPLVATITGPLPIVVSGGSATGTPAAEPTCPAAGSKSFQVAVATQAAAVTQNSTLNVTTAALVAGVLTTTGDVAVAANSGTSPAFVEQGTTPQSFVPSTWHFGGTSLGLGTALTATGSLSLASILGTLTTTVRTVVNNVDSSIIEPLLQALGLDVGNADVTPLSVVCGQPSLLG